MCANFIIIILTHSAVAIAITATTASFSCCYLFTSLSSSLHPNCFSPKTLKWSKKKHSTTYAHLMASIDFGSSIFRSLNWNSVFNSVHFISYSSQRKKCTSFLISFFFLTSNVVATLCFGLGAHRARCLRHKLRNLFPSAEVEEQKQNFKPIYVCISNDVLTKIVWLCG